MTSVSTSVVITTSTSALTLRLGLITSLALIALLILKEMVGVSPGKRASHWESRLNIATIPLLIVFAVIVVARVAQSF